MLFPHYYFALTKDYETPENRKLCKEIKLQNLQVYFI